MKRLTLFLLVILLLVGCNPQSDVSETNASISSESNTTTASELSEANPIYENKAVLKWALSDLGYYNMISVHNDLSRMDLINKMLDESGENYIIEPICMDDILVSDPTKNELKSHFTDSLVAYIQSGEQVDLITISSNAAYDTQSNLFLCTQAGMLEPLSGYLTSAEGKDFYDDYPQKLWDTTQ